MKVNRKYLKGNNRDMRRGLSLLLVLVMLSISCIGLAACGADTSNSAAENAGEIISETDTELTIVDQAGREVSVKKDSQSIALVYRVVIRFLLSLDQGDKIKGIGKTEDFLYELQPSLKDAADVGLGVVDIEALAELKPDLFIHKASDIETLDAVSELGIPAIGISLETTEDIVTALGLLGKVCGAEEKAQALIDYYKESVKTSEGLAKTIADEDRQTAIVMGSSIGKVADGTMLQGVMLEAAGGENCAKELAATELWPIAGTEQIFSWNPDYIFISGSEDAVYSAEDLYEDEAWSELKAVKNKHVYVIPADCDSWEFPGVVSALGINYMMHMMYPELLSDAELESKVNEFYEFSYGRSFSRDELGY